MTLSSNPRTRRSAIERLCPVCGLCCNGVLFGTVRLRPDDPLTALADLGVRLKSDPEERVFDQPCPAHQEGLCQVYACRPGQCREFVCAQLTELQQGTGSVSEALIRIRETQVAAGKVRGLLERLGERNKDWPLSRRCQRYLLLTKTETLTDRERDLRGELTVAVHTLARLLKSHFYQVETVQTDEP